MTELRSRLDTFELSREEMYALRGICPDAERECWECRGSGKPTEWWGRRWPSMVDCFSCSGRGWTLNFVVIARKLLELCSGNDCKE